MKKIIIASKLALRSTAMLIITITMIISSQGNAIADDPPKRIEDPIGIIETAQNEGIITEIEALELKLQALFLVEDLPLEYRYTYHELDEVGIDNKSDQNLTYGTRRCGTLIWDEILKNRDRLSPEIQEDINIILEDRQTYNQEIIFLSSNGHFLIHYSIDASDEPHIVDDIDNDDHGQGAHNYNLSNAPDLVEKIADYLETSWSVLVGVDAYHFDEPPKDGITGGGNNLLDIYIVDLPNGIEPIGGITTTRDFGGSVWIHIDNSESYWGDAGYKDITSHELFHAIQASYDYQEAGWIKEGTSVFIQDVVFDNVDSYIYDFLNPMLRDLNKGLLIGEYKTVLFWKYLAEHYGTDGEGNPAFTEFNDPNKIGYDDNGIDFIKELLIGFDDNGDGTEAIDHVLNNHSSNFELAFTEWLETNFTKNLGDPFASGFSDYLEDEQGYNSIQFEQGFYVSGTGVFQDAYQGSVNSWAGEYIVIVLNSNVESIQIEFDGEDDGDNTSNRFTHYQILCIRDLDNDGKMDSVPLSIIDTTMDGDNRSDEVITNDDYDQIVVIVAGADNGGEYTVDVSTTTNVEPTLSNPGILPGSTGYTSTNFEFQIIYEHIYQADSVVIQIDGPNNYDREVSLNTSDNTPIDGSIYTSTPQIFNQVGNYTYSFKAIQGINLITTIPQPFTVTDSPPEHDLQVSDTYINQSHIGTNDSLIIRAQVKNISTTTANNVQVVTTVMGPSHSWSDTLDIGTLGAGQYWPGISQVDTVANWPGSSSEGQHLIQIQVTCPTCDGNWSDNTVTHGVIVSDEEPLVHMYYRYEYFDDSEFEFSPSSLPPDWLPGSGYFYESSGDIEVWVMPKNTSGQEFYMHLEDGGVECRRRTDGSFDLQKTYYECADKNAVVAINEFWMNGDETRWFADIILGETILNASISPPVQTVALEYTGTYQITLPCSSCSYSNEDVYVGTGGDDPPLAKMYEPWDEYYNISGLPPNLQLVLEPRIVGEHKFVFDTGLENSDGWGYFIAGKIIGYEHVDNPPEIESDYPLDEQVLQGQHTIAMTALDDFGVDKVEFYIDGDLKTTKYVSPYTYDWDTTAYADQDYTVTAKAYDTENQTSTATIKVTVDNLAPVVSNINHSPSAPADSDHIVVQATIADSTGLSVGLLKYSNDGGVNWSHISLTNPSAGLWQATIPAQDQGQIKYKIEATDGLGRTTTTSETTVNIIDQSPPIFFGWIETPINLTEDSSGDFRVALSVADIGGSGIAGQIPQIDYRIGIGSYDGYQAMTNLSGNVWYFDIPSKDWHAIQGQTVFYRVQMTDIAGNLGVSDEQNELIESINDQPEITFFAPVVTSLIIDPYICNTFEITGLDIDGDPIFYTWLWDDAQIGTGQILEFCPDEAEIGNHSLSGLVSDGELVDQHTWKIMVSGENILLKPTGFTATTAWQSQINLAWSDNSNETSFIIERSLNGVDTWQELVTLDADYTSYPDMGLSCETEYFYRVKGYRSGDGRTSAYSDIASATTFSCPAGGGALDPNFGNGGWVTTIAGPSVYAVDVAIQSDNKIAVIASGGGAFYPLRYNPDGSLDPEFGGAGIGTTVSGAAEAIAIQDDGKLVAAGTSKLSDKNAFCAIRYNTDGSLDSSFSDDGIQKTIFYGFGEWAFGLGIQADQKIVLAGTAGTNSYIATALLRYTTGGTLDTSFSGDGKVVDLVLSNDSDLAYALEIQNDGKIVVAGYAGSEPLGNFTVLRHNTNGSLDTSFSGDGIVMTQITTGVDRAKALAIQSDGKIVVVGYGNTRMVLVRYNANGSPDTSFSTDGIIVGDYGTLNSVAIQNDGKIVAAGHQNTGSGYNIVIMRFNSNGTLDPDFGTNGVVITDLGGDERAYGLALQQNGDFVVVGAHNNVPLILRYLSTALPPDPPKPATPTDLIVDEVSLNSVTLKWNDNSPDETEFFIERSLDGLNNWIELGQVIGNFTNYMDTSVERNTTYHYRVRGFRSTDGEYSEYSDPINTTTPEFNYLYLPLVVSSNSATLNIEPEAQSSLFSNIGRIDIFGYIMSFIQRREWFSRFGLI